MHVELFQGHRKCQDCEKRMNKIDLGKNGGGKKWTDLKNIHPCWQERSALQLVAVKQSTGNNVSGHYFYCYFLLFLLCFELSVSVLVSVDPARLVLIGEKVCCQMF